MPRKKAYEIYGSFEDWITAHKHSSVSVSCALEDSIVNSNHKLTEDLGAYIVRLEDIRSEIDSEILEAKDWMKYLRRQAR
jgi:Ser/Thr protein kinase RdoA (MazF antagonist)